MSRNPRKKLILLWANGYTVEYSVYATVLWVRGYAVCRWGEELKVVPDAAVLVNLCPSARTVQIAQDIKKASEIPILMVNEFAEKRSFESTAWVDCVMMPEARMVDVLNEIARIIGRKTCARRQALRQTLSEKMKFIARCA